MNIILKSLNYLFNNQIALNRMSKNMVANNDYCSKTIKSYKHYYLIDIEDVDFKALISNIKLQKNSSYIDYVYKHFKKGLVGRIMNKNDVFLFVPSDSRRFVERGFGLNEELMNRFNVDGFNVVDALIKIRYTTNQSQIVDKNNRLKIIDKPPYALVNTSKLDNVDNIYLFDDISSSGGTLLSCAKVIKASYPDINIIFLTLGSGKY